jgi:two-component system, chemotaxis family, response regulator Rcp1
MLSQRLQILLIDDSPSDVRLLQEAMKEHPLRFHLRVASDGVEATQYLQQVELGRAELPDLVILDLNLPKKNGYEVLSEIKCSASLKHIPVVIMTSSQSENDISHAYRLNANCYITKPGTLNEYMEVVRAIEDFWFSTAKLPELIHPAAMSAAAGNKRVAS